MTHDIDQLIFVFCLFAEPSGLTLRCLSVFVFASVHVSLSQRKIKKQKRIRVWDHRILIFFDCHLMDISFLPPPSPSLSPVPQPAAFTQPFSTLVNAAVLFCFSIHRHTYTETQISWPPFNPGDTRWAPRFFTKEPLLSLTVPKSRFNTQKQIWYSAVSQTVVVCLQQQQTR